jgi:flagellum-specific peptidoglycan hydrolase FlgJ
MGLGNSYWDRSNPDGDEVATSSVATLENGQSPLPRMGVNDKRARYRTEDDQELTEFLEFFTLTRPDLAAPRAPQASSTRNHSRFARATERVARLATARPEVSLPHLSRQRPSMGMTPSPTFSEAEAPRTRRLKLPPVWVLTNLAIVVALLIGFAPQIMIASAEAGCKWYTVRPGDTLWGISHRYGKTINGIAAANHIQNVNLIYVNQRLCIPMTPIASASKTYKPTTSRPPTTAAPGNVKAFIKFTVPYAKQASRQTGWPVSMILAQWGLETGWRVHTFTGYNWGNCGAIPGMPKVGGTSAPGSPAAFSYAYTPSQGVAEYVHVAHLGYYRGVAPAWRSSGANAAARALGRSPWDWGHYTNRGSPGSSLITIMQRYNLYWYDSH